MREVSWVIFDEIHYMRDRERGYAGYSHSYFRTPRVVAVVQQAVYHIYILTRLFAHSLTHSLIHSFF